MTGLTVVIPSRNLWNLGPCIHAITTHEPTAKMIVVDDTPKTSLPIEWLNGSDYDGAVGPMKGFDRVRKIEGFKPFCFAKNSNAGILAAMTDDVVLLNDDALLESPSGFIAMHREAAEHPEYGVIAATTNLTGQPLQWRETGPGAGLREVPHCAFVCVLIPRRTITKVGFLDERYCLDYGVEDRDYCEQVRAAGLKVAVCDYCFVDHSKLTSTYRGDPKASTSFEQNKALFMQKWPGIAW